jgi:hypothetical protein
MPSPEQSWQRAKDFNGPNDVVRGTLVLAWTLNGSAIYRVITPDIIVIGQSPINFDVLTVSGSAAPGCATAEAKDGQILISAPLTSKQMWTIRDVKGFMQTTGGLTIDMQLDVIPQGGVPPFLTVRGVGRNNLNNFAPQCDGTWPIIATSNPYIFTLGGSVWGPGMDSSGGVAYGRGRWSMPRRCCSHRAVHAGPRGGKVKMPPRAGYYLQSGSFPFVENTTFAFGDGFLQKADAIDQLPAGGIGHSIAPLDGAINQNTSKAVIRDLWVFDGRTHSIFGAGQHAFEGGSSHEPQNWIERLELIRVHVRNSSGYGGSTNNENGLKHFIKRHGSVGWCDGDTWDRKNTLNANYAATFEDEDHNWQALWIGRHQPRFLPQRGQPVSLAWPPIRMPSG